MKKIYIILFIFVIVILVVIGIRRTNEKNKIPFKEVSLIEYNNVIVNFSSIPYIDTVAYIGLDILNVENVNLIIYDISDDMVNGIVEGHIVNGFVVQVNDSLYRMFLQPKMSRFNHIKLMAHELIHVKQIYSGRLVIINGNNVLWRGLPLVVNRIDYFNRPWEEEAYGGEVSLSKQIRYVLY